MALRASVQTFLVTALLLPSSLVAQATASGGPAARDSVDFDDLNPFIDPAPPWDHPLTRGQWDRLEQMREEDPQLEVHWEASGVLSRLKGRLGDPVEASEGGAMAFEFMRQRQDLFMQPEPADVFETDSAHSDAQGWTHVRLQQMYQGIPVEGAQIAVHFDEERTPRIVNFSHFIPALTLSTTAQVDRPTAIAKALSDLDVASASGPTTGVLVIYKHEGTAHLAWKVRMFIADPLGDFVYFVDARSGVVIDSYNNLMSALDRKVYDAETTTVLPGTLKRTEGGSATADASVNAAYDNAGIVYNYFNSNHSRDGINGSGATIISTVHYDVNLNNAFWNGTQMVYGDGDGVTFGPLALGLDVVAHELVHGITQHTSNLIYQDESGALNESLSDIFAALIDPDWLIGEDVYTPGTGGDALRNLSNPTCCNQPDHYDDVATPDASGSALDRSCHSAENQDNGCVHINSGIPNKAAYLMSAGGTFHGIAVTGIGNDLMGDIWYEAQVNWLTRSDDFADARQATIDGATNLYGAGHARVATVRDAWAAVGVGVPEASTVPSVLAFGNVELSRTLDLELTLSNPGDVDLIVTNVTSNDAQFTVRPKEGGESGTSFTVVSGGSSPITVRYTPDMGAPGDDSGTLSITHNAADSPKTVAMTGSGTVIVSGTGLNFNPNLPLGTSETQPITLTNPTGVTINISSVVATSGSFNHDASPPFAIGAGASAVINVTFNPSTIGLHKGQLLITHNPTVVLSLTGGKPINDNSLAGFGRTTVSVPFGAEYVTLLLAGAYGVYTLRRRRGNT